MSPVRSSISRGLAIFLGVFTLLNVAGDLRFRGSDANLWWIDFTPLPAWASRLVLVLLAVVLLTNKRYLEALADRVRTAAALYRKGLAPRLFFSGGPGDGTFDEPASMTRYAESLGVPASAIVRDPAGVNTESTVRNAVATSRGARILAVSHFYHLPRIKMTFQRYGMNVYTVPSETSMLRGMPYNLVREDVAFWAYYLRRFGISTRA